MAQKIVLAELDIDIDLLLKSTSDLKKQIDSIKNAQKELVISGKGTSEQFIENEAVLKSLNSAYASNVKAIQESGKATENQVTQTELLNMALNTEVTSIAEAREQNKLLNKLRNETNTTTAEGQAQITALNKKLDENNDYIKSNADAYLKQKINIGNYTDSVREAFASINPLNGGLGAFTQRAQEAGGAGNLFKGAISGMVQGVLGLVKASLAFIATPIGAVLAVIGVVLGTLIGLFKSLDPVMDKVEQGFAAISAIIDVVRQTFLSLITGAKSLKEAFSGFGSSMASAAKEAANLKNAQQDLADAQRSQEVANAKASQQYDELIVKSKNRTLTEKERIAYIQQAQKIEEANFRQRSALAEAELKNAIEGARIKGQLSDQELTNLKRNTMAYGNYLLNQGRITEKELEAIKKAELGKISIKDETTKRLEKAQNQEDKLAENAQAKAEKAEADAQARREKAQAAAEKAIDRAIEKQKSEIDKFIAGQGIRAKSLEESVRYEEQLRDKRLAVLEFEKEKGKKTQTQYEAEKLEIKNSFLQKQTEATIAQADLELQIFLNANKSKLDANKFLSDELYRQELERLNKTSEAEAAAQTARLVAGTITAEQYNTAIKAIDDKFSEDKKNLDLKKSEEDKAKQAIDLENKLAADTANRDYDLAFQTQQLEAKRLAEVQAAEKTGADTKLINDKYAKQKMEVEAIVASNKLNLASQTFGNLATILGKESAAGKAMAVAQTTIDTYQSATAAYKAMAGIPVVGPALGAVAAGAAVVSGIANVKKILSTDNQPKFEQGGIQEIGGKRHSAGGTKFWGEDGTSFEAEAGEGIGILNRRAFGAFMDFNNNYNGGSSNRGFFAGGGIITQGVKPNTMDLSSITEAIASMPAPIVAVDEIQRVGNRYAKVQDNANF
jgi:hypothetical protein